MTTKREEVHGTEEAPVAANGAHIGTALLARDHEDDATPHPEGEAAPPPRAVPREDLAYLLSVAETARQHDAHVEQMRAALARAMQEATYSRGAAQGEYARLRLRHGVGEGEDFDGETGMIFNVAERQAAQARRDG